MDVKAIRDFVQSCPSGVLIRMIDRTEYRLPHRDYIWFMPASGETAKPNRFATAFRLHDPVKDETRLVNAPHVKAVLSSKSSNGALEGKNKRRKAG